MKKICLAFIFVFLMSTCIASCSWNRIKAGGEDESINPYMSVWRVISAADGDRCAMTPSCSAYAAESIKNYGFFEGYLMTCDRLIRCGRDELRFSPIIETGEDHLCLDPPNENKIR